MRSSPLLTAALVACFLLTSCANSAMHATGLPKPLPAAALQACPVPPAAPPATGEVDPVAIALAEMYALYGLCAGRFLDLLNRLDGAP